jgi:hypothetical protein
MEECEELYGTVRFYHTQWWSLVTLYFKENKKVIFTSLLDTMEEVVYFIQISMHEMFIEFNCYACLLYFVCTPITFYNFSQL